jgi:GNAT superfamily N-acetyltransferase
LSITINLEPITGQMDFSTFRCGNGSIDTEVSTNAYFYNLSCEAKSFAITLNSRIIGCVIMGLTRIDAQADENARYYYAIELRTIAIIRSEQGRGYGSIVLDGLIARAKECAEFCGCRYIILTSVPDCVTWYSKRGFTYFPYKAQNRMFIDFRNEIEYNDYANQ